MTILTLPAFAQKEIVVALERGLLRAEGEAMLANELRGGVCSELLGGMAVRSTLPAFMAEDMATCASMAGAPELAAPILSPTPVQKGTFSRDMQAWTLKMYRRFFKSKKEPKPEPAPEELPKLLTEEAILVGGFINHIPTQLRAASRPKLPFEIEEGIAYRGLALETNGKSLEKILTRGVLLEDCGEECNTLNLAYASHGGYGAMKHFIDHPTINLTYGPNSAVYWGSKRLSAEKPLLAIVKVKGDYPASSLINETADIPAENVMEVVVRLERNGQLMWYKVEWLKDDGVFKITPYEYIEQPK